MAPGAGLGRQLAGPLTNGALGKGQGPMVARVSRTAIGRTPAVTGGFRAAQRFQNWNYKNGSWSRKSRGWANPSKTWRRRWNSKPRNPRYARPRFHNPKLRPCKPEPRQTKWGNGPNRWRLPRECLRTTCSKAGKL